MMSALFQLQVSDQLDEDSVYAVAILVERVAESDGVRPLSEHVMMHVLHSNADRQLHICARLRGKLVGYAHLDLSDASAPPSCELAVHPDFREAGAGGALLDRALVEAGGRLSLWSHGTHGAATALAESRGLVKARELLRMRRSLLSKLPEAELPSDVFVRGFVAEADSEAWLDVNARAFVDLPDQGGLTAADLAARIAEPWFDPAGFLIAREIGPDGVEGKLVGFHWTKIHGDAAEVMDGHGHEPVGEVYVLGIDPEVQSRGLGRALTLLGLEHLKSRGLKEVILYVESTNIAAIRTYEKLGFRKYETDVMFSAQVV